jgi:hypothetical protein
VKTVPRDGAKGVDRDKSIKVTFSEAMNPASINDRSVELLWFDSECTFACSAGNKVPATVRYDANARTATLDPDERLTKRRLYYIVVWSAGDDQALDDDGSSMEFTYVGSFKTGRR